MRTLSEIDRWFDEYAEDLLGLPVADAILDVMSAGVHVELSRPGVHRVRDGVQSGVTVVANRQGVVVDVWKLDEDPGHGRRSAPGSGPRPAAVRRSR